MSYYPLLTQEVNVTASTFSADYRGMIKCDCTSNAITVTLPDATKIGAGAQYIIKKSDSTANAVTIATTSSQTIDGSTTKSIGTQYGEIGVFSDGSNWEIVTNFGVGLTAPTYSWATLSGAATAAVNTKYEVNCSGGSFSCYFPSSATSTQIIGFKLVNVGSAPANTFTMTPYTTIDGSSVSLSSNRVNDYFEFEYGVTGWRQKV